MIQQRTHENTAPSILVACATKRGNISFLGMGMNEGKVPCDA